jgi:hypothetical protein
MGLYPCHRRHGQRYQPTSALLCAVAPTAFATPTTPCMPTNGPTGHRCPPGPSRVPDSRLLCSRHSPHHRSRHLSPPPTRRSTNSSARRSVRSRAAVSHPALSLHLASNGTDLSLYPSQPY